MFTRKGKSFFQDFASTLWFKFFPPRSNKLERRWLDMEIGKLAWLLYFFSIYGM